MNLQPVLPVVVEPVVLPENVTVADDELFAGFGSVVAQELIDATLVI